MYNNYRRLKRRRNLGSIAQLGEHLPYKQRVTGSSPVVPTKANIISPLNGLVVQLVRTLACHARGRGFGAPFRSPISALSDCNNFFI